MSEDNEKFETRILAIIATVMVAAVVILLATGCSAKRPTYIQGSPVVAGVQSDNTKAEQQYQAAAIYSGETPIVVSPYFGGDGEFLGTMVGGSFIPDGPGTPMIQSALLNLSTESFWDGWFNFFSISDREYAHVELMNGILLNAYAEYERGFYKNNVVKIAAEHGTHEIPIGRPDSFDVFAKYFIQATSTAQDMGIDVWTIIAGYATVRSFDTINKSIDSVNSASGNAVQAGAAGFGAGSEATINGVTTGASLVQ